MHPLVPVYLFLATLAAAGFLASLACHVLGWLQIEPPWGRSVLFLHVGCLALCFTLLLMANRMRRRHDWAKLELMAELPKWVRVGMTSIFAYAMLNFAFFIYCTSQYPKHGVPFTVELRGISGHWLMFYGIATAGFVSLARYARRHK